MSAPTTIRSLADLTLRLRAFAAERDWDRFHEPRNLAMALAAETAELAAHFRFAPEAADWQPEPAARAAIEQEIADVLIYLVRLADKLETDLHAAVLRRLTSARGGWAGGPDQ
jgi:NTP pyrophosphatase (non-canonical NTP hydrolase)